MAIYPKVNGAHKEMTDGKVKVGGVWKQAATIYTKVKGVWKKVWRSFVELGERIYYEWTESGTYTDRYREIPTNGVRFRDFSVQALNAKGQVIGSKGTSNGEWTSYSTSIEGGEVYASISVKVDITKGTISYTVTMRPNTSCVKVTLSVGQVLAQ